MLELMSMGIIYIHANAAGITSQNIDCSIRVNQSFEKTVYFLGGPIDPARPTMASL